MGLKKASKFSFVSNRLPSKQDESRGSLTDIQDSCTSILHSPLWRLPEISSVRRPCLDVSHSGDANELLEIPRDELRPIVGDDSRFGFGELFASTLEDRFDVGFLHFFADFPVDHKAAETIEDRALKIKRARDVEIRNVQVPVLMRREWLLKAGTLLCRFGRISGEQCGAAKHAVNGRRAHRHGVVVEHHVRHPAIAFGRIAASERFDRESLVVGDPVVAWNPSVVFVDLAEALLPVLELAAGEADPFEKATGGNLRPVAPVPDMINDVVARIRLDPFVFQVSPSVFFRSVKASASSATTSFFCRSFSWSWAILRSLESVSALVFRPLSNAAWPFSKNSLSQL